MPISCEKTVEKIVEQADSFTPEQTARLAGVLLSRADVNRQTVEAFIEPLSEEEQDELVAQLESLLGEEE